MNFKLRAWLGAALAIALCGAPAFGQATTGSLAGQVVLQSDQTALPGAAVEAVHQPTGTRYSATTREDGRFTIPNVRVGGPYTVTVTAQGFQNSELTDVYVALGVEQNVSIGMNLEAVAEAIVVTAEAAPLINPSRTGAASSVSVDQIQALPTVRRSLQDFARTNPYFTVDNNDASSTRVTVAGRNNRYNQIQIDGAVNNDLFGLSDTGTPGGSTDTQPISLDAIQEIQLVVSPYDVRQGGFTGGGINAITRSGSNAFSGSLYGSVPRNEDYVGKLNDRKLSAFEEKQYGLRLGGRIIADKLFFFVTGEKNTADTPTGFSADGNATNQFRTPSLAQNVADSMRTRFGFDPGGLGEITEGAESKLGFVRLDWNAANNHQVTFRHNYVDATKDRIETGSRNTTSRFSFPTYYYQFPSTTNSTVVQVNSAFSSFFNEARIGYQTIREHRDTPGTFADIEIRDTGGTVFTGINRFSHANALDQDVTEITDDVTLLSGNHTITVGTHNELFTFRNLFLDALRGYYLFNSYADFEAGRVASFAVGFSNSSKLDVSFDVNQYGLYAGDAWRLSDRFTLNYGVRVDMPTFPDSPSRNPLVDEALGIDTSDTPSSIVLVQPRIGFNWAPGEHQQLRGGVGVFAGRTPYVWLSNNYQNSGVEFSNLSVTCPATNLGCVAFHPDQDPPRTGAGALPRIDAIDPDFESPQVLRTTLGYDRELPWGIQGSIEALYSKSIKDANYINANSVQNGTLPDGRPRYTRRDARIDAVYFLKNNSDGKESSISARLNKRFDFGLDMTAQYTHGSADTLADLTSSRAVSNFRFAPQVDPIHPETVTSFFEVEHRGVLTATYAFKTGPVGHSIGLYYNVLSGAPYTIRFSNDVNGDTADGNDPLFVPASADQVVLTGGLTWDQLNNYINSVRCLKESRGSIVDVNSCNAPYTHQLDFHYGVDLPVSVVKAEVTFDVLNLMNLIDSDNGRFRIVSNNAYAPIRGAIDPATGKWSYSSAFTGALNPGAQFTTNDLRSRWQAKVGLRLSF